LAGDVERGFEAPLLIERLTSLASGESPIGIVCGSGFEDRPTLLNEIARYFPLYGNGAEIVARAKDPRQLARLCHDLAIPHPSISFDPPANLSEWLVKHQGGGGGIHIASAHDRSPAPNDYYQRYARGTPISVLLLGDGGRAQSLGTSAQWPVPSPAMPFRFGGAVRPADIDPVRAEELCSAAEKIAVAFELVGLNSIDFLIDEDGYCLLEVNPRTGATLDIFADRGGRLFTLHLDACRGHLPSTPLIFTSATATAIAYAPCDLEMPDLDWPAWTMDRQKAGTRLRMGDPVCTVFAETEQTEAARALVSERVAGFREHLMNRVDKESVA
jgi:predicted ATP-grasp superfamily ATP-dependent carboligase